MSSFEIYVAVSIVLWIGTVLPVLIYVGTHSESPNVQGFAGIIAGDPQRGGQQMLESPGTGHNQDVEVERANESGLRSIARPQAFYQGRLRAIGRRLDERGDRLEVLWEYDGGYLMRLASSDDDAPYVLDLSAADVDLLAQEHAHSRVRTTGKPVVYETGLQRLGRRFDERSATVVVVVEAGNRYVAGGLQPSFRGLERCTDSTQQSYHPFEEVVNFEPTAVAVRRVTDCAVCSGAGRDRECAAVAHTQIR